MALSIKTDEADRLARTLARLTGETMTEAVTVALRERLARERARRQAAADLPTRIAHPLPPRHSRESGNPELAPLFAPGAGSGLNGGGRHRALALDPRLRGGDGYFGDPARYAPPRVGAPLLSPAAVIRDRESSASTGRGVTGAISPRSPCGTGSSDRPRRAAAAPAPARRRGSRRGQTASSPICGRGRRTRAIPSRR